jgi:hypothetical protein
MPAILTHYTFAVQNVLDPSPKYEEATFVGAQGPDPFFFFGRVPFHKRKNFQEIDQFGSDLHHIDLTDAYAKLIDIAVKSPDKELLLAYIDGLFLHYCLDRNCHAYIFYETGYPTKAEEKKKFGISHMYFETILDFILAHKAGTFGEPSKTLNMPKEDALKVSKMWAEMNKEVMKAPHLDEKSFYFALKDYQKALHSAYSATGKKKAFFKKFFGTESYAWGMSYPQSIEEFKDIDFLNEKHGAWYDPVTGVQHTESFLDLIAKAKEDYGHAHEMLIKAANGLDIKEELRSFVGGIDHDGSPIGGVKKHAIFVWPRWPL